MSLDAEPVAVNSFVPPAVDLSCGERTCAKQIASACESFGVFQLIPAPIERSTIAAAVNKARDYFTSEATLKRQCLRTEERHWGWYDRELTKNRRDHKEIFDIGPDATGVLSAEGNTPWPHWCPRFESAMRDYAGQCLRVCCTVLGHVASALEISPRVLSAEFANHSSFLRLNSYPANADPNHLGIHHHTDAGALTLLAEHGGTGLQIFDGNRWRRVEIAPDALLINIGDLMQVWSNDKFRAPLHRVSSVNAAPRLSLAFFYNPDHRAVIEPLTTYQPPVYRPFRWGDYRGMRALGDYADHGREVQVSDYRREKR